MTPDHYMAAGRAAEDAGNRGYAVECYGAAAKGGFDAACADLGRLQESVAQSSADIDAVALLYRRAAEAGDPHGQFLYGRMMYDLSRWDESRRWLGEAVRCGHPGAEVWSAMLLESEPGDVRKRSAAAVYERLVSVVPQARVQLAYLLLMGEGVPRDRHRAESLYRALALEGCPQGWFGLGLVQWHRSDAEDPSPGFSMFERAADEGLASACEHCGLGYVHGWSGRVDFEKGRGYLLRASAYGFARSIGELGGMHLRGWGGARDPVRGRAMLEDAFRRGDAHSGFLLGLVHWKGDGVKVDRRVALEIMRDAARQGSESAGTFVSRRSARWWRFGRR